MLIHVRIVHKEMVLTGVMEIVNGSMNSVNLKVCNPQFLKILGIVEQDQPLLYVC